MFVNLRVVDGSFLSTLSLRRATQVKQTCRAEISISIHALLAESDRLAFFYIAQHTYFYPRSPCGERPYIYALVNTFFNFYPRSPCGERQYLVRGQHPNWGISIHALLAESDPEKSK